MRALPLVLFLAVGCAPRGALDANESADDPVVQGDDDDDDDDVPVGLQVPEQVVGIPMPDLRFDLPIVPSSDATKLRLTLDHDDVRVFDGDTELLGGAGSVDIDAREVTLSVSFAEYRTAGTLLVEELDAAGAAVDEASVAVLGAPLLLSHHLQPAEMVYAVQVSGWGGNNGAFIDGFADVLGPNFMAVPGNPYWGDVWMQDEIQFATLTAPGLRHDVIVDSIRDRGLDDFAEDVLQRNDVHVRTWGGGRASSLDSFGNLELSPPVTVEGVDYPFGRIYYGVGDDDAPVEALTDFLAEQQVQKPFTLDTSWLCVGHVDEYTSFVPDPSAPKGFRFLITDTDLAWDIIDSLPAGMDLPVYAPNWGGHGYDDVGEIASDSALRSYNDDIQRDYLDPQLARIVAELGLTDDDIVKVPGIFEPACGPYAAALIPGMVNMSVATDVNGVDHAFLPDPFFRTDRDDQSTDPFIAAFEDALPSTLQLHFIDDWSTYHMGLGEVHCGSNVRRTPTDEWWASAVHLVEDN